ncbi:MAG: hypothetical protein LBT50_01715, partial [Prevotellaceae bacterium]|nr:hypothetical protein [Prevotellaceae bacterium]
SRNIEVYRVNEAIIEREKPGYIHIDGDPMLDDKILKVKAIPDKLKIIVPSKGKHAIKMPVALFKDLRISQI